MLPAPQWTAHVSSKQHRASLAREKDDERKRADRKRQQAESSSSSSSKKRKADPVAGPSADEQGSSSSASGLPAGFFADPSAAPRPSSRSPSPPPPANLPAASTVPAAPPKSTEVDSEFDDFLASIAFAPSDPTPSTKPSAPDEVEGQTTFSSAPQLIKPVDPSAPPPEDEEEEETPAELKKRLEREEREEIMGRLLEEEQAQEEAFERVDRMKDRLLALKKVRFLSQYPKSPSGVSTFWSNFADCVLKSPLLGVVEARGGKEGQGRKVIPHVLLHARRRRVASEKQMRHDKIFEQEKRKIIADKE